MAETTVSYNPFEPGFIEDPYAEYAKMRREDPIHRSPLGFWVLFGYEDITRFLKDPTLSVEDRNATPTALDQMVMEILADRAESDRGARSMLSRDPPDHTRLRKLVTKAFTPRVIQNLRPRIQELVDEMLDEARERRGMDVISDFAFPLPFIVISEMLGVPAKDGQKLREWSGMIVRSLEPIVDPDTVRRIVDASDKMFDHVSDLIAWKRKEPGDDLLSALIAAEEHGDVLSDDELVEQVVLLYIAGHETTVNLVGNGVLALLRNRDEMTRMRKDPALSPGAVEEMLRYDSPVQMTRRITLTDVEIGGKTIEKGAFCALVLAAANRDPDHFGLDAEMLDIGREQAHQHLSFGGGAHYCLGAALARLEGEVAIGSLVNRFPDIDFAGEPAYNGRLNLRGLETFPVSLGT
ncbi:MAG TPA: cytochrome P450 [Actinomycetota bacterium]|nr:cytochrome P450 [Actinomycetota bacterium]